jgi:Shedu protein SduA, C-terminal
MTHSEPLRPLVVDPPGVLLSGMSPGHSYAAVFDGPAPTPWDEYKRLVLDEWHSTLAVPDAGEAVFQEFLEQFPCMIPGHDAFNASVEPGPIYGCVFTQPMLPGITRKFPDFMWLPTDSQTQWAVLVEIEDPEKRWLTVAGQQTAHLTQAVQQVREWKSMLAEPANLQQFTNLYNFDMYRPLRFKFCLIYGRRSQVSSSRNVRSRQMMMPEDIEWMTFDRLRPSEAARDYVCARVVSEGDFKAVSVPATIKISPYYAWFLRHIRGKSAIVKDSKFMSDERKKFLAERFQYWDKYLERVPLGIHDLEGE